MAARRTPRKLTEEKQIQICAAIALGCSRRAAARLADVSAQAIIRLEKTDPAFAERMDKSRYHRETGPLRAIHTAAQKNWRAAAWVLQRLDPDEYMARKPNVVSPEQMHEMMRMFADVLCRKFPGRNRDEVVQEIERIVEDVTRDELAADERGSPELREARLRRGSLPPPPPVT